MIPNLFAEKHVSPPDYEEWQMKGAHYYATTFFAFSCYFVALGILCFLLCHMGFVSFTASIAV